MQFLDVTRTSRRNFISSVVPACAVFCAAINVHKAHSQNATDKDRKQPYYEHPIEQQLTVEQYFSTR